MTLLQTLTISTALVLLSCNNYKNEPYPKRENKKVDSDTIANTIKCKETIAVVFSDTFKRFVVDDYPVTNKMLLKLSEQNPYFEMKSGTTISHDKGWFCNDTLKQTIVFELYTDYHRIATYHFYNKDIPDDLIIRMELHSKGGELALEKQKRSDFGGLLKQATKISSSYFTSKKGFELGDTKLKAIDTYGKPEKQSMNAGIETLEWEFIGDLFYNGKTDLRGKPLAKESFGHQIVMYFKNGKLIGQILHNDIP